MEAVEDVTVLPRLSCTVTVGGPVIVLPATALAGCVVNTSFVAAPAFMSKAPLVAPVKPVDDAVKVYPLPALSIERLLKLPFPAEAVTVVVPLRVPLAGLFAMATVTDAVEDAIAFPKASWTATVGGPAKALPAEVVPGCVIKASFDAVPLLIMIAVLVAPVRPVDDAVSV